MAGGLIRRLHRLRGVALGAPAPIRLSCEVAIHEFKHKWDEVMLPERNWFTVDMEVPAHPAQAVYARAGAWSLFQLPDRLQGYHVSVRDATVRKRLAPLIVEVWRMIDERQRDRATRDATVAGLEEMYRRYRTVDGEELPDLHRFFAIVTRPVDAVSMSRAIAAGQP